MIPSAIPSMSPFTAVAVAAWCVLLLVWIPGYIASRSAPRPPRRVANRARQLAGSGLLFLAFVLLFRLRHRLPGLDLPVTPPDARFGAVGAALALVGIAFAIWARVVLGTNWSGLVMRVKEGQELVQTGPYAIVRHPIYAGLLAALLGTALTVGTLASYLAVAAALGGILIRVELEERLMAVEFGAAHAAYRRRTRKLVPFVW